MSGSPTLEQLVDAWRAHPPRPAAAEALVDLLKQRFRAYEVPATLIPRSDYEMDDDVVADDVWKLFFITDPDTVNALVSPAAFDREKWPPPAEEGWPPSLVEDWAEVFGSARGEVLPVEEVGYRLFTSLVGKGMALGIALESRDGRIVDGFKVYGPSDLLADVLIGHISWEKYRATEENPYGVAVGDIADEDFVRYLRMAHVEGLLRPAAGNSAR
ncbi:hypothetical protein E4U02_09725 [Microbacterium paludicola]|uniref:Uncharacterized protein n=1 Tax=Microbacterium paludicola TaxID=300019 RepID=A0A4Y9FUJ8_9MICO|nr:hypothetical protein [Microbacterium paludicola]MBF0816692.1 hypothetical protein [Microbacterium paludicola]TFU32670.1 hypothetical protein E4U02_09725 [Microbacterium paludicola]